MQKDYYKRYGTSMRGLMTVHGMQPDDSSTSCTRSIILHLSQTPRSGRRLRSFPAAS